jgi:hypothetical protein
MMPGPARRRPVAAAAPGCGPRPGGKKPEPGTSSCHSGWQWFKLAAASPRPRPARMSGGVQGPGRALGPMPVHHSISPGSVSAEPPPDSPADSDTEWHWRHHDSFPSQAATQALSSLGTTPPESESESESG